MSLKNTNENKKPKYGMRKLSIGLVSCLLGFSMIFGSPSISTYAENPACEMKVEKSVEEQIKEAKDDLKKYLATMNKDVVDNESINYEDKSVKDEIKKSIKRAEELLEDENIDSAKLEEIKKIPFKKVNGKKQGLFRSYTKKALVDFEVVGDKEMKNPHNNKKYTLLKDNKIIIKTSLKDAGKIGENDKIFFKLNYVKNDDYDNTKVDVVTSATPKYKKQEIPAENYTVKAIKDGYEIEIKKLPENTKLVKPIVLIKFADGTFFENGDIVFVKSEDKNEMKPEVKKEEKSDMKDIKKSVIKFVIGEKSFTKIIDGKEEKMSLDVPANIENGRTLVPLRAISEALGADVQYDAMTKTITIIEK